MGLAKKGLSQTRYRIQGGRFLKDMVVLALVMATLGQIALCCSILVARASTSQAYLPLAAFFMASGVIAAEPAVALFMPELHIHLITALFPAYLLLGPMIWLYVSGLTSETVWTLARRHIRHLIPFGFGLVASIMITSMPFEIREGMFIGGATDDMFASPDGTLLYPSYVAIYLFLLVWLWVGQSGYYVIRIFRQLTRYRQRLKDLFASNENRELGWITGLLIIVGSIWLISFIGIITDNIFDQVLVSRRLGAAMSLILVWSIGLWGVRQKPGFEGRYLSAVPALQVEEDAATAVPPQKYERSALAQDQADRIARKLKGCMEKDHLYLDANLSLHKLAKHLSISPNHISQTLNETMETTFFDYVNMWRINAAKPKVLAGNETILAIAFAVGFNARSSFYKAFKQETGQTPGDFRKTQQ